MNEQNPKSSSFNRGQGGVTRRMQIEVALSLPPVRQPSDVLMPTVAAYLEEVARASRAIPLRCVA